MRLYSTFCLFVLLALAVTLNAGDRWNVRAMGMGRTSVAGSRGTESIGINPANLAAPGIGVFSLSLAPVGAQVKTDLISYDIYQEYFTGIPGTNTDGKQDPRILTEADKQNLLSSFPGDLATTRINVETMVVGATVTTNKFGGLGAALIDRATASVELPKDFARFFLYGLDSAGSRYSFDGTNLTASWWREYNISYAFRLRLDSSKGRTLFIGLGVKFLRGYGSFETQNYSASIANRRVGTNQYVLDASFDFMTRRSGVDFLDPDRSQDYSFFPDPAGTGVGYDLGVSAQIGPGLFVGASITDIGKIHWDTNIMRTGGRYSLVMDDPLQTEHLDSLEAAVRGHNLRGEEFSTSLPTALRIGVAVQTDEYPLFAFMPGKMLLAFDYTQGLNSSMGNITQPRFSLGVEYRIVPFVPLRTGLSIGGGDGVRWAGGFALDFRNVCLDVATENFGALFSRKIPQMISIAAGLKIVI